MREKLRETSKAQDFALEMTSFFGGLTCCLLGRKSGRWCRRCGGKRRQTARLVEGKEHIFVYHINSYQIIISVHINAFFFS